MLSAWSWRSMRVGVERGRADGEPEHVEQEATAIAATAPAMMVGHWISGCA